MIPLSTEGGTRTLKPFRVVDFETEGTEPSGADHAKTPENQGDDASRSAPLATALPLQPPPSALSTAPSGTVAPHRLDLVRALAGAVVASFAAGDTRGARFAVDTLRGLVDAQDRPETMGSTSDETPVIDLAAER